MFLDHFLARDVVLCKLSQAIEAAHKSTLAATSSLEQQGQRVLAEGVDKGKHLGGRFLDREGARTLEVSHQQCQYG